jgi:hypothetical protein
MSFGIKEDRYGEEEAHIKPFSEGGSHEPQNGLLTLITRARSGEADFVL